MQPVRFVDKRIRPIPKRERMKATRSCGQAKRGLLKRWEYPLRTSTKSLAISVGSAKPAMGKSLTNCVA
jgi:hypothetical protein